VDIKTIHAHHFFQTTVSATALLVAAGMLATPLTANAGEIAVLCGTTISTHVTIDGVTDEFDSSCSIEIADGASLTLKNSSFIADDDIDIDGFGTAMFTMKNSLLESDHGGVDVEMDTGSIDILFGSTVEAGDANVSLASEDGDISVKDSSLSAGYTADIEIDGANVSIKNSTLDADEGVLVDADYQVTFIDNVVTADGYGGTTVRLEGSGNVIVRNNDFDIEEGGSREARLEVGSVDGTVTFKDNTGSIMGGDDARLEITSDTGKITVINNVIDFRADDSEFVTILSITGDLTVKGNELSADYLKARTDGSCTSVGNTPDIPCK